MTPAPKSMMSFRLIMFLCPSYAMFSGRENLIASPDPSRRGRARPETGLSRLDVGPLPAHAATLARARRRLIRTTPRRVRDLVRGARAVRAGPPPPGGRG